MSWNIGIVQMDCVTGDLAANLARIEGRTREAVAQGAGLVLFPECATTGYFVADRIAALAEPIPGPSSRRLAALARATGAHLVVGMIEAADGVFYDDAVLFAPDGALTVYRKAHLFGPERAVFAAGNRAVVAETRLGRLGLTVCYDLMFPEYIRALVLDGAEMILNATDWISDDWQRGMGWGTDSVVALARTRALENGVHVAMADRAGVEAGWTSLGGSTVAAPTGRALAALGADEDMAVATIETGSIDLARWSEVATYLPDRRPELYGRSRRA
ncbi:MAG TPA: carbon-nitrogen hydrolase family protein [Hyphomicrobiales bacterium]|nr:carbon-nitrogen hydrolase family protein [Hyphomicrobiales bacterium]